MDEPSAGAVDEHQRGSPAVARRLTLGKHTRPVCSQSPQHLSTTPPRATKEMTRASRCWVDSRQRKCVFVSRLSSEWRCGSRWCGVYASACTKVRCRPPSGKNSRQLNEASQDAANSKTKRKSSRESTARLRNTTYSSCLCCAAVRMCTSCSCGGTESSVSIRQADSAIAPNEEVRTSLRQRSAVDLPASPTLPRLKLLLSPPAVIATNLATAQ